MALRLHLFAVLLSVVHVQCLSKRGGIHLLGPQAVNLWKLDQNSQSAEIAKDFDFAVQAPLGQAASPSYDFRAEWFQQPLDHFDKSVNHTWHQRFWVNSRHYRPRSGAPVIVIDGGETSGEDRLSFLDTGIADILAKATGGIGVVLEHRYYGASVPVANFSTDAMRWLNNAQSAADSANFMGNVQFDGIQEDITAPNTPWIYYGGSYAGARAAHMKVLYPELVYGAIASSAVTHAQLANWEYMTIIRDAADPTCSSRLVNSIATIDSILQRGTFKRQLKALFGLADLTHDEDFASVLEARTQSSSLPGPFLIFVIGTTGTNFDHFCKALAKPFGWFSDADVEALTFGDERRMVTIDKDFAVDFAIVNYGRWIKKNIVSKCKGTIEECFGTFDDKQYHNTGLDQEWRLWLFQVCTEWGYFTTPPPNQNEPSIISRLITLGYESKICKQAFPPGVHMRVPSLPNITVVNELGDFDLAADRLAFIDGEVDPWRPYTPHSRYADDREDTLLRPFKLIPGGVHHWDEWGLKNILEEPAEIRKIHSEIIEFVREWLKDWKAPNTTNI